MGDELEQKIKDLQGDEGNQEEETRDTPEGRKDVDVDEGSPKTGPNVRKGESTLNSRPYSITRMLRAIINNGDFSQAKHEKRISDILKEDVGLNTKEGGFLVPFNSRTLYEVAGEHLESDFGKDTDEFERFMTKAVDKSNTRVISEGDQVSSLVEPQRTGDFIDLLRNESVVEQAGATSLDLPDSGQLDIPKMKNGAIAYWRAENESLTESDLATGDIKLRPNYLGCLVKASKESLRHSTPSLEAMIRNDMAQTMALKEDETFIYGTSAAESSVEDSDVPYGLLDFDIETSSTSYSDATDIIDLEANLTKIAPTAWVMNKSERASILKLEDGAGHLVFMGGPSVGSNSGVNSLMDIPIIVSEQIDDNDLFLGDWSQAIIARDSAMELTTTDKAADAFTKNQMWFKALLGVDFGVRYTEGFLYNDSS